MILWDVRTGREALRLRGAPFRSSDPGFNPQVAWSPDGRRLAASNFDFSLSVWNAGFAEEQRQGCASGRRPLTPLPSPDASILHTPAFESAIRRCILDLAISRAIGEIVIGRRGLVAFDNGDHEGQSVSKA